MNMQNALEVLEFSKIAERASSYCKSELSKAKMLSLTLLKEDELIKELKYFDEGSLLYARFGMLPISSSSDLSKVVDLAAKGYVLSVEDLERVAHDILNGADIKRFFNSVSDLPLLMEYVSAFPELDFIEKDIHKVIAPNLSIFDNASPALKHIRISIARLEKEMITKLGYVVKENQEYLSDTTLTLKNGHYVLPVANSYKNKVSGIIQDVSGSGGTTFIEPAVLVEMNNRMAELKNDEREEIRRILGELSREVGGYKESIKKLNSMVGYLDFLQAKSLYMEDIKGHIARLSEDGSIRLLDARHPLLAKDKVVPNDFVFESSKRCIIISGPNAGGKTVALKTLGLCIAMFEMGLPIPAKDGAEIPYFKHIFLDIGDSQSISDNLSTFSGHMHNIGEICSRCGGKDLVLLDEVGTGTAPLEGEAIAYAIVKYLLSKHAYCLISSHFEGLKSYALSNPQLVNASMLFDTEKLMPTYRLKMGLPGESYGLSVALRFGLDEKIIDIAKTYLAGSEDVSVSKVIDNLSKITKQEEDLRAEGLRKEAELARREEAIRKKEEALSKKEEKYLSDVQAKKERLLSDAQKQIEEVLEQINHPGLKMHEAIAAKKKLEELETIKETERYDGPIELNDYVLIPSYNIKGKVTRIQGNKIEITTQGGVKFNSTKDQAIRTIAPKEEKVIRPLSGANLDRSVSKGLPLEINLLGLRVDEAIREIDHYLDTCRMRGYKRVRLIHGLGTGALRKATREYLEKHKEFVDKFESAGEHEGGLGATIVYLK